MKVSILAVAFTTSLFIFASNTYAACNTVMGGCTAEETVNVAPHMHSSGAGHQKKSAAKPADRAVKQPSTVAASKPAAKKL